MTEVALTARIATHGVLLEPRGGGIRMKLRGQAPVHVPYEAAEAVAQELAALAAAARRVRR